jgi:hypothetical protein
MPTTKRKPKPRPPWTLYSLLARRPFEDDVWLRRWLRLKEELGLTR